MVSLCPARTVGGRNEPHHVCFQTRKRTSLVFNFLCFRLEIAAKARCSNKSWSHNSVYAIIHAHILWNHAWNHHVLPVTVAGATEMQDFQSLTYNCEFFRTKRNECAVVDNNAKCNQVVFWSYYMFVCVCVVSVSVVTSLSMWRLGVDAYACWCLKEVVPDTRLPAPALSTLEVQNVSWVFILHERTPERIHASTDAGLGSAHIGI